ncbi:MAG: CRISPR-associated protein [Gammaproteobacteria bacterium]|nr:MAG: CRISPR-associated protein [Gammaproteobacteria bacterium]TND03216.1 MAG: CRISPR-associated protein Cas5 family [Gammaproteobacteria bacterium]
MKNFCLEVSGDFACFTRPEMKVERVSYDVITPSAARAVFEAILWKPAIRWQVSKIEVLHPIKWINLRRNEVGCVASTRNIEAAMKSSTGQLGIFVEDERQQRAGLFLRDVRYRIHAHFELRDPSFHKPNYPHLSKRKIGDESDSDVEPNAAVKFMSMFERRAAKGQCINQPYLGCREFAAHFSLVDTNAASPEAVLETRDLGYMLYDLDYSDAADPKPRFFRAQLVNGVLDVPALDSEEVRG